MPNGRTGLKQLFDEVILSREPLTVKALKQELSFTSGVSLDEQRSIIDLFVAESRMMAAMADGGERGNARKRAMELLIEYSDSVVRTDSAERDRAAELEAVNDPRELANRMLGGPTNSRAARENLNPQRIPANKS